MEASPRAATRLGIPTLQPGDDEPDHAERFWSKVRFTSDCWEWTANRNSVTGYGNFWLDGMNRGAHRVAYELLVGAIGEGLMLDHLCRNRGCVNVSHLEPVTNQENVVRGAGPEVTRARHESQTHCKRNHLLAGDNVRVTSLGRRECVTCRSLTRNRSRDERRRAA